MVKCNEKQRRIGQFCLFVLNTQFTGRVTQQSVMNAAMIYSLEYINSVQSKSAFLLCIS